MSCIKQCIHSILYTRGECITQFGFNGYQKKDQKVKRAKKNNNNEKNISENVKNIIKSDREDGRKKTQRFRVAWL